jgi:hypothetical protein
LIGKVDAISYAARRTAMLRLTRITGPNATTLKLEGKLTGPWVDEVKSCWVYLFEKKTPVDVDLHGLSFPDPSGTTLLLRMERQGARLLGGAAFIRHLLHPELFRHVRSYPESTAKES